MIKVKIKNMEFGLRSARGEIKILRAGRKCAELALFVALRGGFNIIIE